MADTRPCAHAHTCRDRVQRRSERTQRISKNNAHNTHQRTPLQHAHTHPGAKMRAHTRTHLPGHRPPCELLLLARTVDALCDRARRWRWCAEALRVAVAPADARVCIDARNACKHATRARARVRALRRRTFWKSEPRWPISASRNRQRTYHRSDRGDRCRAAHARGPPARAPRADAAGNAPPPLAARVGGGCSGACGGECVCAGRWGGGLCGTSRTGFGRS